MNAPRWQTFVGPAERWDTQAAGQFAYMARLGLRGHHRLLDVGCGSLRAGRLFIPYLQADRYFGIEPEAWLLEDGKRLHVGDDLLALRRPRFITGNRGFPAQQFRVQFDFALAQSVFTHASLPQIALCLRNVAEALKPGGVFAATYQRGSRDSTSLHWVYPDCVSYTEEFMLRAATVAGLAYTDHMEEAFGLRYQWGLFTKKGSQ